MSVNALSRPESGADGRVPLFTIFSLFLRIGLFSFGGGLSGWVYREVVLMREWLTEAEFMSGLALSQMMPGANIANLAVYIGMRMRGIAGASVALLGLLACPFFGVILLVSIYDRISGLTWLTPVLDGITAAALGLILLIGGRAAWNGRHSIAATLVTVATFFMVGVLRWPLLLVVLGVVPVSIAAAWPWKKRHG